MDKEGLKECIGECHCEQCGEAFYQGEYAYCIQDEDGSLIWYCDDHSPAVDTELIFPTNN